MDVHLKNLLGRYHEQFGSGPGLGPGSATCLLKVEGISPNFIKSIYKASAALYRTEPWKRLRPNHLLSIGVGKDSDWPNKKQPFPCCQLIGGDGGDLGLHLFRSESDALKMTSPRETLKVPNIEILRVIYEPEELMFLPNKRMVKSLNLEVSGEDRYPVVDVARCDSSGVVRFRYPTLEELRFVYGVMRAVLLVHPLLEESYNNNNNNGIKWTKTIDFEPFVETVDVHFPPEMGKSKNNDLVAVTVSYPPGHGYGEKIRSSPILSPTKLLGHKEEAFVDFKSRVSILFRQCIMCDKEVNNDQYIICNHCRGIVYCSALCQKQHWKEVHKSTCGLFKAMMDREDELAMNAFVFPTLVDDPCQWLESLGIHQKGMWRRKCKCYSHLPFGLLQITGEIWDSWGGLEDDEYPRDSHEGFSTPVVLSGWLEYYNLRYLPLSSPVADILSHPLTIYYILTALNITTKNLLFKGNEVIVHYLGPEGELDWMPAFAELNNLLNGTGNLLIIMIGPSVPNNLSGTSLGISSQVRVNFVKGLYQEQAAYLSLPNVVIGLNCGLEDYSSWGGALDLIKSRGVSAFFTDQTEISCANAKQVIRGAGLRITYPVTPNPFRSPLRKYGASNNLPSYSNGFVLGVNA